ncbi:MAG: hypothetical protein NTW29_06485 [Bacteroidetes bacterium]|nr:hypothetical protein [Bacteroidota bacterium]
MEIVITKKAAGKAILSCRRSDTDITWKHTDTFFVYHDLCHYTVETILPLKNGFYGMLSAGTDITEFDLPAPQRTVHLNSEALFAEHLVNIFLIDHSQGRIGNVKELVANSFPESAENGLLSLLTNEKTTSIRQQYDLLIQEWQRVSENESLHLTYDL